MTNLLDHVHQCKAAIVVISRQPKLMQSMHQSLHVLKPDIAALKQKEVKFCAVY